MRSRDFALSLATLLFSTSLFSASAQTRVARVPACRAYQLSLNTDNENGAFNGMSHSGTLLVLRNLGPDACSVPARPDVVFEDAEHHALPISWRAPVGMHPGPVILPVVIPAGAEVTSRMRWVSSDAYGANNGISPAYIAVRIDGHTLSRKFTGQLFGPAGQQPEYSASLLERDPAYQPTCGGKPNASAHSRQKSGSATKGDFSASGFPHWW